MATQESLNTLQTPSPSSHLGHGVNEGSFIPVDPAPVSPTPGSIPDPLVTPISPWPEGIAPSLALSQNLAHSSVLTGKGVC